MPVPSLPASAEPSVLQARLLGRAWIEVNGRLIEDGAWPPRGGRDLLLLLLATPGHRLSRDQVLDSLWPGLSPDSARNAYYKALHSLRRTLEPGLQARQKGNFLRAETESLSLQPGTYKVDIDDFVRLLASARSSDDSANSALLSAALSLYRGDLLADELHLDWAADHRERLKANWQQGSLHLAGLDLAATRYPAVIERANLVLASDPASETAHLLLIDAYAASGQRDLARRQYERCVAILRDDLGVAPSAATVRAASQLLQSPGMDAAPPPRRGRTLPVPPTRLIGRETELERIQTSLIGAGVRLLTLLGPGGVGKTRLAIDVAAHLDDDFADGATFVALATTREVELVPSLIVQALGLREDPGTPGLGQIQMALRERSTLLVLDNFEQVRPAAGVVAEILASCPGVRILVTSREPLHLRAEHLLVVPPLNVPEIGEDAETIAIVSSLERSEAGALFLERARAIVPDVALSGSEALAIARICDRLDGLPLAIELAAARSQEFSPGQLLQQLDDRMGTLIHGYQDLPARQQTMRDTIAWSHDLLEPDLQRVFRRMALFPSGCTPEIASRLSDGGAPEGARHLQALIDKSLAYRRTDDNGHVVMLETTRDFALDELANAGEMEFTTAVLVDYAVELTTAAVGHLAGHEQGPWLDRLDLEDDTLRAALGASVAAGDADDALTIAGNLWRYWWSRGVLSEGRTWLDRALSLAGEAVQSRRGLALGGAAALAESQGDFRRSVELHLQALHLWQAEQDLPGEARARSGLGTAASHRGDFDVAREHHERALQISRTAGDRPGMARTLDRLGTLARHQGKLDAAEEAYAESLALFRELGDLVNASIVLSNLGEVLHRHGDRARAAKHFEEALRLERELDLPDGVAFDLANLARVRLELGEIDHADALIGQGVRLFREMGNHLGLAGALAVQAAVERAQGNPLRARQLLGESLGLLTQLNEQATLPEHLEQLSAIVAGGGEVHLALQLLGAAESLRAQLGAPATPLDLAVAGQARAHAERLLAATEIESALALGRLRPLADTLQIVLAHS